MNTSAVLRTIALTSLFLAGQAHADLQTWRLEATVYEKSLDSFSAPSFVSIGSTVFIDYLIDESTSLDTNQQVYQNAIKSITFNGETSIPASGFGYVLDWSVLNAINAGYWEPRNNDAVDFISLNIFSPVIQKDLHDTLIYISQKISAQNLAADRYPQNIFARTDDLRIDFGENSVYARPISITAVPEPQTYAMMLAGFGFIGFVRSRRGRRF